jgi:hypothetical protein
MTGQDSLTDSDAAILRNVREGKPLYDPQVARLRQIQRQYGFTFAPKKTEEVPQPAATVSPTPSRTPAPAAPPPSPTPTPSAPVAVTDPQVPRPQPPAQSPAPAPAMGLRNVPNPLPTTPPEFKNDEEARTWLNAAARSSEIRLTESQHALRERLNDQAGDDLSRALASAGDMLPGLTDLVSGVVQENLLPGPLTALLAPVNMPIYAASKLLGSGPAVSDDAAQTAATAGEGARKVTISTRQIADWASSQVQTANFEREREDMVRQQLGDAAYEFPPLLRQEVERRKAAKEAPYDDEGTARRNALTYEIYNRNKDLEQAFEGRPEYYQGGKLVQRTPDIFGASPVTVSNPITGNTVAPLPYTSTGLAIAGDPLNIAAGAFGGLSKLRLLSRAGSRLGIPLGGIEKGGKTAGAALTGFADRLEDLVNRPRIDPATGQPVARSLNLSAVSAATGITAGTVLYQMDDSGTLAAGVGAVGLAPLALRGAGFTFQKVGSSAGKWSVIAREMAAGPLGSGSTMKTPATQAAAIRAARPAVAEELLATGNVPPQYAKYMRTATDDRGLPTMSVPATRGADSTLKRVAQNREAPPAVRIAARAMDRSGLTGGFRMLDDAFSGGVSGVATGLPFAAIAPEPEYAGAILGGSALFGTVGGPVGGRAGRRKEFTDSDVARMMVDIKSRGGDPFTIVQQAKPKELATAAAMQGIMANKGIDFMPLRADEYGAMVPEAQGGRGYHTTKDKNGRQTYFVNMGHYADFDGRVRLSDIGDGNTRVQVVKEGQDPYSFVVPESRKGRLRVKDGDEVKAGQMLDNTMSNSLLAAAHEFMHPIMLSDMFAGPHKPVLHGLMYDMYGPEGIEARKREYVGLMVDDDIASGVSPGSRVEYTAQEQSDMATGKRTPADIMRERGVVDKTRDELIADKIAELDDQYQREFGDRNAWIADEMLSEYWRSYGNEIDINKLRGSKSPFDRARAAEGVSVFNQRLLGLLGMKFDPQTGKPLTIPSQLFRDNPLIDTPVIRRRVNETVRLYDQYLQGLEDAGAIDAPGTPLPKTDNANDYANDSRVVMPEDPTTGVRDDDFAVVGPDGNARFREPDEIKAIEEARAGQVADLASREGRKDAAEGEFGLHVDDSGRKILRGPKLPDSFYLLKSFPEHAKVFSRQLDEVQDRGGVVEVTFNRVGEKKDNGSWKPTAKRSAAESVTRRMIPFDREVTKTSQINVKMLDLDAVNVAAMKMINEGKLPSFNNDLGQLTADLKTYLANHRAGRPGETGLTVEKRNILNALVGTGTAVQRKANALVGVINPRGAIRSVRIDRIVRLKDTAEDGLGFDNDRVKGNRMPAAETVPDGMPDVAASGRGGGMPSAPRRYVPMEQFINEAGDDLGAVLANAYADMDINEDRNALVGFVDTRNSMYRQRIPVKEFFDWLHSDEPMRGLVFDSENKPATAGEGASYTREGYEALLNRLRDISLRKPKKSAAQRGQAMPDVTITPDEARRQGLVGPVYHGSPDFKGRKFDPKYRARSSGLSRGGFSFTEDVASADSYAGAGVDSAQAAVDAANDVMRDLGARMEAGLKLREFADVSEVPEFNVRYADDMDELASYFNDLSKRIPKDLGARLRDAAKAINEPANPVVVEAYLRNPKEMMIDGKRLLLAENPDDIFVSAARPPQQ